MEEEKNDFQVEISREGKEKSSSGELDSESKESHPKEKKKTGKKLKEELAKKEEEIALLNDKLLRIQAEFENYKKRMTKEKSDLMKYAHEEVVKEVLHTIDNLEMAVKHAKESDNSESITEGMEIIVKQFLKSLERFGVKGFDSIGEKFDPHKHEAVIQVESAEQEPDTVIAESQKGYFMRDRLLRPALVTVTRAPQNGAEE
jgi:molecular chaperone GrpE